MITDLWKYETRALEIFFRIFFSKKEIVKNIVMGKLYIFLFFTTLQTTMEAELNVSQRMANGVTFSPNFNQKVQ